MSAADIVREFIRAWEEPNNLNAAMRTFMADDCLYENIGLSKTTGPDEAIAFFEGLGAQLPLASIKVDMLAIMAQGDQVLTERVDHLLDEAGNNLASLRVMGIFELRDGKVAGWRDYFDTLPFASMVGS